MIGGFGAPPLHIVATSGKLYLLAEGKACLAPYWRVTDSSRRDMVSS
ncbi:hypothetical protein RLPCCGM1_c2344 [Rhizobium leguminosarum bv. phaseoli CCGM1]|nr:hypothetical protein RLPCCGM1_c2344 [Rhizobium leguminosarum bv. phaseoli CCGM1]